MLLGVDDLLLNLPKLQLTKLCLLLLGRVEQCIPSPLLQLLLYHCLLLLLLLLLLMLLLMVQSEHFLQSMAVKVCRGKLWVQRQRLIL